MPIVNGMCPFYDPFTDASAFSFWDIVQTGSGMAFVYNQGSTAGAKWAGITTGTTINSETILTSKKKFSGIFRVVFSMSLSQRIANQEFYFELVEVDESGSIVTSGTDAPVNNARNAASWLFDGTTATTGKTIVRNDGIASVTETGRTTSTTAPSGSNPNFLPQTQIEIGFDGESVYFESWNVNTVNNTSYLYRRNINIPNPNGFYKIRLRAKNLGTAPASTTTFSFHNMKVLTEERVSVDLGGYMGRMDYGACIPVGFAGDFQMGTGNHPLSVGVRYDETTTALAGAATYTGTSRDTGLTSGVMKYGGYGYFNATFVTDQAGTGYVEVSTDGSTWRIAATSALVANVPWLPQVPVTARYYRCRLLNGATLQGYVHVSSAYSRY